MNGITSPRSLSTAALLAALALPTGAQLDTPLQPGNPVGIFLPGASDSLGFFRPEYFLAGSGGTVLHLEARDGSWDSMSVPGETRELVGLHATFRKNIWVGAVHGAAEPLHVYRWDGFSWTQHVLDASVLPAEAIAGRPRPGGIWTFGATNTYVAVTAALEPDQWWLVHWNGFAWTLLATVPGGRANGGVHGVSPVELYFVGEPTGGPGLWRYDGDLVEQVSPNTLHESRELNGVVQVGGQLVLSGLTSSARQAIWRGEFSGGFSKEFEASHTNSPVLGMANNWCLDSDRMERVVGADVTDRATVYEDQGGGVWLPDPTIAAQNPCGDAVQLALAPGDAALVVLRSCTLGGAGDDVHAFELPNGVWQLSNPPGSHTWTSVWATGRFRGLTPLVLSPGQGKFLPDPLFPFF